MIGIYILFASNDCKVSVFWRNYTTVRCIKKATTDNRLSPCRDDKIRTCDPYVPNVVRYQLRYIPIAE